MALTVRCDELRVGHGAANQAFDTEGRATPFDHGHLVGRRPVNATVTGKK